MVASLTYELAPSLLPTWESPYLPRNFLSPISLFILSKIAKTISNWNHCKVSPAGKTTLINSSILYISFYYLFVYPVPDFILDEIAKLGRKFFWAKVGDRKGIYSIILQDITLGHTEWGLSIKNIKHPKLSLMAKNGFKYINYHNDIWVDILHLKYSKINFSLDAIPPNCS